MLLWFFGGVVGVGGLVVTGFATFYWGATIGHLIELVARHDDAPYNAGPILITDIGLPLIIVTALWRLRTARAEPD